MKQSKQSAIIFNSKYLKTEDSYFSTEIILCNNFDRDLAYVFREDQSLKVIYSR